MLQDKMMRIGPAGLGSVKDAVGTLKKYSEFGFKACEIAFTYQVYIKESQKKEIKEICEMAKRLDIKLSIHAPYWINLNSKEKRKIEESKKRILQSCKIGNMLNARLVVFHPGYYNKISEQETYENIKKEIIDIQKEIKKNKWKIKLAPETTGKVNVFGKEEEILKLVRDTGCFFTIDFAHLLARSQGKMSYKEMYEKVKNFKSIHAHFSGITYGSKGERMHTITSRNEIKKLLTILPKNKDITLINESPNPVSDSLKTLKILKKMS